MMYDDDDTQQTTDSYVRDNVQTVGIINPDRVINIVAG